MKTVLAPNAPWPVVPEAKTVIVKKQKPARVQMSPRSRIANTNERYRLWAEKNLGASMSTDPYASEKETKALIRKDVRTPAMKKLDEMLKKRGSDELGADIPAMLYNIAVELIEQLEAKK